MPTLLLRPLAVAAGLAITLLSTPALPHGGTDHGAARPYDASKVKDTAFGRQGDPKQVTRSVVVDMTDDMRFTPAVLTFKRGETVRLNLRNKGKVLHEFVLGTPEEIKKHHEQMLRTPGMPHDEPQMAHVEPGKKGEVIWQFTKAGEFQFGCLLPGHLEAGMTGKVVVR